MRKISLSLLAVVVKILFTVTIGFIFSNNIAIYTSLVSRTHEVTTGFLLYILLVDVITLIILTHLAKIFFTVSSGIKSYMVFAMLATVIFWVSDVGFIMEIKSDKVIHHLFTLLLLLNKYVVFILLGIWYVLQIYKIKYEDKEKIFLNYNSFTFKRLISKKLFARSAILYNNRISAAIYVGLLFYINFLSLFLYSNTVLFFLNIILSCFVLFFMFLFTLHQLTVIMNIYKIYDRKKILS